MSAASPSPAPSPPRRKNALTPNKIPASSNCFAVVFFKQYLDSGLPNELIEAALMDGAGRFKQAIHVTLPAILPTVAIMLIMAIGNLLSVGYEKIILMYNAVTMETADVISSFVYRKGLIDSNYASATAIGLFNSVLNCLFLVLGNTLSKRVAKRGLW